MEKNWEIFFKFIHHLKRKEIKHNQLNKLTEYGRSIELLQYFRLYRVFGEKCPLIDF